MKKVFFAGMLALSLSACATVDNISTAIQIATVGVQSPVTKRDLYNFENGMIIAFAGLNAYKRVCVQGSIPPGCKDTIRSMQIYTRQLPPLLTQARTFVKSGDQINARLAYNTLIDLYNRFKTIAVANNVKVQ